MPLNILSILLCILGYFITNNMDDSYDDIALLSLLEISILDYSIMYSYDLFVFV
jgi:hypothetical protein